MARHDPIDAARFAAIFGAPDPERRAGAQRLCKVCGGWHLLDSWPHNCREPDWRPPQYLEAPMLIADVPAHMPVQGTVIEGRVEQREWMRKNGAVEHEPFNPTAGTHKQDFKSKTYEKELVDDIKRAIEEDPLNRPPPEMIEEANEKATDEEKVSTEGIEVIT